MQDKIIIKGAREHNLKDIDLEIPRNKMIVFTGLSGSGKSSLAFDTIFAEGQRRYVESLSAYARQFLGQMDKPDVDEIEGLSPAISIDQKAHSKNPRSTVATITEIYDYLRVLYARIGIPHCPKCKKEIRKMTPEEMVDTTIKQIENLGNEQEDNITILAPIVRDRKGEYYQMLYDFYNEGFGEARVDGKIKSLSERITLARHKKHTIELVVDKITLAYPLKNNKAFMARLAEAIELSVKYGHGVVEIILPNGKELTMSAEFSCPDCAFAFPEIEPRLFSFNSPQGACKYCSGLGTEYLFSENLCPVCGGKRLRDEALHVLIKNKNISEITALSVEEADNFFKKLKLNTEQKLIAESVLREIQNRLKFMMDVGLDYLTLARRAGTLSGGEAQRIRLASQVGSRLVGALYILDEPTIGLHQKDNERLIKTLTELRDLGNTVIVVEHDEDTIWSADHLVDLGPGAGKQGGYVIANGSMPDVVENKKSLTAAYLRGDKKITVPAKRRGEAKKFLTIKGAKEHNLKNINVKIPLKRFVMITGVSGSGKSTLTEDIMYRALSNKLNHTSYKTGKHSSIKGLEHLDKIINVDQSPIGRTPRSNPATYTGIFTYIRDLFASTAEAKRRGYKIGRFSFNRPGGRCENCEGNGFLKIEMHFLPDVFVPCNVCKGKRFDRETLEVLYKGKNIADILAMTVNEAYDFFKNIPPIRDRLKLLKEVGLGYIELGQSATTLSGGEAQRIKLSTELSKRATGKTMYLLDEPTTGLHFDDVKKLIEVLERLVSRGNSVIVIEHNLDVIKSADYIIDLGPEGGDKGGEIIAEGTPEEIARKTKSYTGQYLRKILKK